MLRKLGMFYKKVEGGADQLEPFSYRDTGKCGCNVLAASFHLNENNELIFGNNYIYLSITAAIIMCNYAIPLILKIEER